MRLVLWCNEPIRSDGRSALISRVRARGPIRLEIAFSELD
jgi:hypothetical protein